MNPIERILYQKAINEYGMESQLLQAAEECQELSKAIIKYINCGGDIQNVIEETADVLIMVEQIMLMTDRTEIYKIKAEKIKRLEKRLEGEKEKNVYNCYRYHVQPGDTLWKISRKHQIQVEDILIANEGFCPEDLTVGQVLFIPADQKEE